MIRSSKRFGKNALFDARPTGRVAALELEVLPEPHLYLDVRPNPSVSGF
jgi:hypothetical protein